MALQEEERTYHHLQVPSLFINELLFCEEEPQVSAEEEYNGFEEGGRSEKGTIFPWDEDSEALLDSMLSKQTETHPCYRELISDRPLMAIRRQAVEWILSVHSHYGFSALTAVLAVNCFDRFLLSPMFQRDKPWLGQLVAVACLSLAIKVEETHFPVQLLLQLQVGGSVYVFEPKTIGRMELLVLSTLNWRMNPVSPLAFVAHIIRKLPCSLGATSNWEFFSRCECLILSVLADVRLLSYLPSMLASAAMLCVVKEMEPSDVDALKDSLTCFLNINEDALDQCYELLGESSGNCSLQNRHKRKLSIPGSPTGVFNASFSCESSNESWAVDSSVSALQGPHLKRSRMPDHHQQAGLPLPSCRLFLQGISQ
ncbi:hypothetical protein SAY87_008437 [Trapa incisa]|uniref:Cyclin N-terminal domain-containing protein n=1 Tax=Trapa incisa TaxID=236973 RepID=A0AAN7KNT5_9MYRT|nr:hypothetical protein SAY87_008437 [Trapa incisa]